MISRHYQNEPLAKPLNKKNRRKNRLSDLQFGGFARGSDLLKVSIVASKPSRSVHEDSEMSND